MGLKICSLYSGSTGNSIYICGGKTKLLIDVGVPSLHIARSLSALNVGTDNLNVLITHTHSDHIKGIKQTVEKMKATPYAHFLSAAEVGVPVTEFGDSDFYIGELTISPFRVSHDVPCVGFSVLCGGKKISIATDLGHVTNEILDKISDSNLVMLESNHDVEMVKQNGHYPAWLKRRILGDRGHLNNYDCAAACVKLAKSGVGKIVLAHLSKENNYPELAKKAVSDAFAENGISLSTINLEVACPDRPSARCEIL